MTIRYLIRYGMGGRDYVESFDADSEDEALEMATQDALERIGYRVEGAMKLEESDLLDRPTDRPPSPDKIEG